MRASFEGKKQCIRLIDLTARYLCLNLPHKVLSPRVSGRSNMTPMKRQHFRLNVLRSEVAVAKDKLE